MSFIYDFTILTKAIDSFLTAHLSPAFATTVELVLIGIAILIFYALVGLFLVYAERKICAFFQCRVGPNRVGPYGIVQTIADLVKLLLKELIHIKNADSLLFNVAPFIVIAASHNLKKV